jgi:hypothetical protein
VTWCCAGPQLVDVMALFIPTPGFRWPRPLPYQGRPHASDVGAQANSW